MGEAAAGLRLHSLVCDGSEVGGLHNQKKKKKWNLKKKFEKEKGKGKGKKRAGPPFSLERGTECPDGTLLKWSSTESLGFYSLFECKLARSSQKDDVVLLLYEPGQTKQTVECVWGDWTEWKETIKLEKRSSCLLGEKSRGEKQEQQPVLV